MEIRRVFGQINKCSFKCPPIRAFVDYYMQKSKISIDPFARSYQGCTYTNDLNPNTKAQYHMDALAFLELIRDKGICADLVVFDPPYSMAQVKRTYEGVGLKFRYEDSLNAIGWYKEKDIISEILKPTGVFLHFGYHSNGMGKKRGFVIEEILIVAHGRCVSDTICMAERRTAMQGSLFTNNVPPDTDTESRAALG